MARSTGRTLSDIRIEMHGGFEHYGFHFRRDQSSDAWDLWYYAVEAGGLKKRISGVVVNRKEPAGE